ncbi:hypothetical protein Z043_125179, partial [Scleropages formosus]
MGFPGNSSVNTDVQRGGSVTIPCHYGHQYRYHVKYWCKGYTWSHCTTTVRSNSTQSKGDVFITDVPDQLVFYVTMRNLQEKDAGWYWCGVGTGSPQYEISSHYITISTGTKKVRTESWRSVERGASVTIPCRYDRQFKHQVKYWCRGKAWRYCTTMVRTASPQSKGDVSITDDPGKLVFNVTMRNLQKENSGWYWCGVETPFSRTENDLTALYLLVTGEETHTTRRDGENRWTPA